MATAPRVVAPKYNRTALAFALFAVVPQAIILTPRPVASIAFAGRVYDIRVSSPVVTLPTDVIFALSVPPTRVVPVALAPARSEEHTSELQSQSNLVCR